MLPEPDNWLVGGALPHLSENSIASLVNAAGLVGLCLVLLWIAASLRRAPEATRAWLIPLLLAFAVASQLVPYIGVFPLATLFPIALSLATRPHAAPTGVGERSPAPDSALQHHRGERVAAGGPGP
jgi:hypothetical protein